MVYVMSWTIVLECMTNVECAQAQDRFTFVDAKVLGFSPGDPVAYREYDYATVLIGEQCWFAENLRSENYENGDMIWSNLSDSDWENATMGAVAVYREEAAHATMSVQTATHA